MRFLGILFLILSANLSFASMCEINFVKYINGDMPADITKNPMINMWDERFDDIKVALSLKSRSKKEVESYLYELTKLVHKDQVFNENLSALVSRLHRDKKITFDFIKTNFIKKKYSFVNFDYSKVTQELISGLDIDPDKIEFLRYYLNSLKLPKYYQDEYLKIMLKSNRTKADFKYAIDRGMVLNPNQKDFTQFRSYLEFMDNLTPSKVKSGLKDINKIYNYEDINKVLSYNPHQGTYKKFVAQNKRVKNFELKRIKELEKDLKLRQKSKIVEEIDDSIKRQARGEVVHGDEKRRFKKKIDDYELPHSHKMRAANQAKHEANIFKRLLNECGGGNSQHLKSAAKKFRRFKLALALGVSPGMFLYKNRDQIGKDPYIWEKFGHEVGMGLFYTIVGNKIFTKTDAGFWGKYLEGYWKFSILSYADSWSYEQLFGQKTLVRHFQKLYKKDVPESELDKEFEKLKKSPTFEKDMNELMTYLDDMEKKHNTKNFLDKYFNLSTYSSLEDDFKITQEDLESEEAKEMMMELLAERIYLQNMGNTSFFQTGSKGNDRFLFYRARAVLWDMKGLMVNMAIFEIMCRQPFGKIGSWGAILALVVGDNLLSNNVTLNLRKEAINQ